MGNNEDAAVAAVHRVDPRRWSDGCGALVDRLGPLFPRFEPRRHAVGLMLGLLSGLDCKNCWTIAELRGAATPNERQQLLSRARWAATPPATCSRPTCGRCSPIRLAVLAVEDR